MKRFISLAAAFAFSLPAGASAEEIKTERVQGGAGNPLGVARAIVTSSGTPGGTVQIQIGEPNDKAVVEEIITRVQKGIAESERAPHDEAAKREWMRRREELQKSTHAAEQAQVNAEIARKHAEIQLQQAEAQLKIAQSQHNAHAQQEQVKRQLETMVTKLHASHRDGMRDRVRRQRELTKQATKLLKKLDELDADESPKARDLWKQLERTQAELQQTFGSPQVHTFSIAPGQPAGAVVTGFGGGNFGGAGFGGAGFGGAVSGGGIVGSGGVHSGNVIIASPHVPAQANPTAVHVRPLKLASPQNATPQPSNAEVLKALEDLNVRIKMLEELLSKSRK